MRSAITKILCLLLVAALLPLPLVRASTAGCTSEEARDNYLSFLRKHLFRDFITQEILLDAVESGSFSGSYAFRDLDQDGVDDLVLWLGAGASEGELMTFTMYENAILFTGSIPCLGVRPQVLCADHDTDIIVAEIYHGDVFAYACRIVSYRLTVISEGTTIPMRWKEITWEGDLPVSAATSGTPATEAPAADVPAPNAPAADVPAPDAPAEEAPVFAPAAPESGLTGFFDDYSDFIARQGFAFYLGDLLFPGWAMGMTTHAYLCEDMDNDGTEELIVWVDYAFEEMGQLLVFTMDGAHPRYIGSIPQDTAPILSGSRRTPGLLIISNQDGMEQILKCDYADGKLYPEGPYTPTDSSWYALEWTAGDR